MRFTLSFVIAACLMALVNSSPLPESQSLRSQMLERLMMVENDNDTALRSKRTIGVLRQLFPSISQDVNPEAEHQVRDGDASPSENNEVRVQFEDDQSAAANEGADSELLPLEDIEIGEEENRNKRFLSFGLGGSSGATGGSGGGSGNFLFDIIRMVAGSGSQATDPNASGSAGRTDQEAVPGPITRLFVIANRGISNLIQDIILRLAATSERIVNFKARLITSII